MPTVELRIHFNLETAVLNMLKRAFITVQSKAAMRHERHAIQRVA